MLNFILTTCLISTRNINLVLEDFSKFYVLISFIKPLGTYAYLTYLDIVHFLHSWNVCKKEEGILLVGLKCTSLIHLLEIWARS
jgi:hypothetical protein